MNGRDPGWKDAFRALLRLFMPWSLLSRNRQGMIALTQVRSFWLAAPLYWALFLFVLGFIVPWSSPGSWWVLVICVVGTLTAVRVVFLFRRPLEPAHNGTVQQAYTARFFLGWALSFYPTLAGFIATFVQRARWLYALGIPFAAVAWLIVAPARRNIRIDEQRSKLAIMHALLEPAELP